MACLAVLTIAVTQHADCGYFKVSDRAAACVREPDAKHVLKDTFSKNKLPAEVEVYAGAAHGWCVPDSAVYHEAQAERAWTRLLATHSKALA